MGMLHAKGPLNASSRFEAAPRRGWLKGCDGRKEMDVIGNVNECALRGTTGMWLEGVKIPNPN